MRRLKKVVNYCLDFIINTEPLADYLSNLDSLDSVVGKSFVFYLCVKRLNSNQESLVERFYCLVLYIEQKYYLTIVGTSSKDFLVQSLEIVSTIPTNRPRYTKNRNDGESWRIINELQNEII